jgi:hypothetical protein
LASLRHVKIGRIWGCCRRLKWAKGAREHSGGSSTMPRKRTRRVRLPGGNGPRPGLVAALAGGAGTRTTRWVACRWTCCRRSCC